MSDASPLTIHQLSAAAMLITRLTDDELIAMTMAVQLGIDAQESPGYGKVASLFRPGTGHLYPGLGYERLFEREMAERLL